MSHAVSTVRPVDPELADLLAAEEDLQRDTIRLIASENYVSAAVLAATGSVRVTEQMVIERYSHVMHLVSHVEGALAPGKTWRDVLRAAFPAGTLSGAITSEW